MNNFNGQINISRDLRQNKQTILGKRDLTDIVFIIIGVMTAVLFAYIFGFYLKIFDEFTAVLLSLIPLVLILSFGFRKKAGMRWVYYILLRLYAHTSKNRMHNENINSVIKADKKNEVKKGKEVDNTTEKIKAKKNIYKNVPDKSIFVFETNNNVKNIARAYIETPDVKMVQIRLFGNEKRLLLLYNYSYKEFLNKYTKNEVKSIGKDDNILKKYKKKLLYILKDKKKYYDKYSMYLNFDSFNNEYMDSKSIEIRNEFKNNNLNFIDINDNFIKSLNIKQKKVYMLHLYKNNIYDSLIDELKIISEVVINIIKHQDKYYVSTFIVFENGDSKILEIINKYKTIINKLEYEQKMARSQAIYAMQNPFNSYREYKI